MKKMGVIDSGVGGLSLVEEMFNKKFDIDCYYVCDKNNVPYGGKTQSFMFTQSCKMVEKLMDEDVFDILLACNTLTVETIEKLREKYPKITFVGIEPYVNYLNHASDKQNIALILTPATFASSRFNYLKGKYDPRGEVAVYPLPKLALEIENCYYDSKRGLENMLQELDELKNKDIKYLILGCTHYPLIKKLISSYLNVQVVDPHSQVVEQLKKVCHLSCYRGFSHLKIARTIESCFSDELFRPINMFQDN